MYWVEVLTYLKLALYIGSILSLCIVTPSSLLLQL
jgi:hypothetical protein